MPLKSLIEAVQNGHTEHRGRGAVDAPDRRLSWVANGFATAVTLSD